MEPGHGLGYRLVDVFSPVPFGGNSLPVFLDPPALRPGQMLQITRELRHFEAIFLQRTGEEHRVRARVFDLFEELPFAGHPIIGAAAVLHQIAGGDAARQWQIELPGRTVSITTEQQAGQFSGLLDQGAPAFIGQTADRSRIAAAFNLAEGDLDDTLPLEIVSTGLPYLVIPVRGDALARARITQDISPLLATVQAQFAVLLDEAALEQRHWNNDGIVEDIATGSAAGTIGGYRLRHGRATGDRSFTLHQGRFTGRPSTLRVRPMGTAERIHSVQVGGDVAFVGRGTIEALP